MRLKLAAIVFAFVLSGCETSSQLQPVSSIKPNVASEGTLTNEKLASDTTAGLQNILGAPAFTAETKILKFVIQQPVGSPGARAWREMWVVESQGARSSFLITFKEKGMGSADFEIKKMNQQSSAPPANCPQKIGDYKAGEATSQQIRSCLGSPFHENKKPDGRYVYLYKVQSTITVAFLFDTSGKLINTQAYKQD